MKSSMIGLTSILLCIMLPSVSLAACPPEKNCIDIYDGGSGEVIGDDNFVTETSYDDLANDGIKATLTNGAMVQLEIPDGSQGLVKALMSRAGTSSASPVLNGEQYLLNAAFRGTFKLGAEKTTTQGIASAEAKVFTKAAADNGFTNPDVDPNWKNDKLFGEATIAAKTSSTGTGGTYAIVDGASASYKVIHKYQNGLQANEAVDGASSVKHIEIKTCNSECPDCFNTCVPADPTGSVVGTASISTSSDANYFSSNSYSDIQMDATSARQNSGSSVMTGYMLESLALSNARDGSAPSASGYNVQTIIRSKNIAVNAYAFAANDMDSSMARMWSEASHNQGDSTDRAYSKAEIYTAVKRTDMNSPLTLAKADAIASDVYFKANARDLRTSQKYAFNCVALASIQSHGQLKSVSDIWNRATLQLTAMRTGNDAFASNSEDVSNYGPKSGSASDLSNVDAHAKSLRIDAKSTKETRFISMTARDITCFIFGNTPNPTPIKNTKGLAFGSGLKKDTNSDTSFKQGPNRVWILSSQKIND